MREASNVHETEHVDRSVVAGDQVVFPVMRPDELAPLTVHASSARATAIGSRPPIPELVLELWILRFLDVPV